MSHRVLIITCKNIYLDFFVWQSYRSRTYNSLTTPTSRTWGEMNILRINHPIFSTANKDLSQIFLLDVKIKKSQNFSKKATKNFSQFLPYKEEHFNQILKSLVDMQPILFFMRILRTLPQIRFFIILKNPHYYRVPNTQYAEARCYFTSRVKAVFQGF